MRVEAALRSVMSAGGGVLRDKLKQIVNLKKYYDFTVYYINVESNGATLQSLTLLLFNQDDSETFKSFRTPLERRNRETFVVSFESFMENFTFVTDHVPNMPCIAGASVSSSLVPVSERWMGCFCHLPNTTMKHVMVSLSRSDHDTASAIRGDLKAIKDIVGTVKHKNLNSALPQGYAFLQEVETRFGTTINVVERFIKLAHILNDTDNESMKEKLAMIYIERNVDNVITYPDLDAILRCL